MKRAPAFQFFARDFYTAVAHLPVEAAGAYIKLLSWSWTEGPLPLDEKGRARIAGIPSTKFKRIWPLIAVFWRQVETGYEAEVLIEARIKQEEFRAKRSFSGQLGAQARWGGGGRVRAMVHGVSHDIDGGKKIASAISEASQLESSSVFNLLSTKSDLPLSDCAGPVESQQDPVQSLPTAKDSPKDDPTPNQSSDAIARPRFAPNVKAMRELMNKEIERRAQKPNAEHGSAQATDVEDERDHE
jgi:uncharacterized protein YdaU (DUF1376 family)